jgi:hypothetical protein
MPGGIRNPSLKLTRMDAEAIVANIKAMHEVMTHGEFMRRSLAARFENIARGVIRRTLGV